MSIDSLFFNTLKEFIMENLKGFISSVVVGFGVLASTILAIAVSTPMWD